MTFPKEKLNTLPYPDYVKSIREISENLTYSRNSSDVYQLAREIIQHFIKRFEKDYNHPSVSDYKREIADLLTSTENNLEDYIKYARTQSAKDEVIAIFKSDMEENTRRILYELERQNK